MPKNAPQNDQTIAHFAPSPDDDAERDRLLSYCVDALTAALDLADDARLRLARELVVSAAQTWLRVGAAA